MRFGLTQRELVQYTQEAQPSITSRGAIDQVIDTLIRHYEKCETERLSYLSDTESKRTQKLEAERDLQYLKFSIEKKEPIKVVTQIKTKQNTKTNNHSKINWMKTLKPGNISSPCLNFKNTEQSGESPVSSRNSNDSNAINQSHKLQQNSDEDQEQYFHLPIGLVRQPTARTKQLLITQDSEGIYELANQIVYLSADTNAKK